MRRAAPTIALLAVLGAVFGFQAAAIGRTGFVWDELVMLREAVERTRPASRFGDGVTLAHGALSPLARGCRDAIATLGSARVLWLVFSMLLLGALALLAAALARAAGAERGGAAWSAVVAVTTLALTPMYQRWALQVRIDQPAIAAALLGGVALLYSRRVLLLALLAGVLMGIAVCCSARAGSVVALALLLANAERRMRSRCTTSDSDGASSARSLTPALALLALGAGGTVIAVVALYSDGAAPFALALSRASGIDFLFPGSLAPRSHEMMWPALLPHALVLLALVIAAPLRAALRRDARVATAVAALAIGALDVAAFGVSPPSSWLYCGCAMAMAIALALPPMFAELASRVRALVAVGLSVVLLTPAVPAAMALLIDTQRYQRVTLRFAQRLPLRGYHSEGALACKQSAHLPILDRDAVERAFAGSDDERARSERFLATLERSGARFVLASYQLGGLPRPVREALARRFIRLRGSLLVPGLHLHDVGDSKTFYAFAAGHYRFDVVERHRPVAIWIDGQQLWSGDTMWLSRGRHALEVFYQPILGSLVYDVATHIDPGYFTFYERSALGEYAGSAWRSMRLMR